MVEMYRRFTAISVIGMTVGVGALTGCTTESQPENKPPELAKSFCWGAFTRPLVQKYLAPTSKVSIKVDTPFDLYNGEEYRSCLVYADGNAVFSASAERIDTGGVPIRESVTWRTATQHRKKRIDVGEIGAMAKNSAVSAVSCAPPSVSEPAKSTLPDSEKNILLRIDLKPSNKDARTEADITTLMRDFVNFTRYSFDCLPRE